jgi:Fuc2NAc and GlcNAc transferase
MTLPLLLGTAGFFLAVLLTGAVLRYAIRNEVLDRPNERSSHSAPTPRGGGLGILLAVAIVGGIGAATGSIASRDAVTLGAGMMVLGLVGWLDDTRSLEPRTRLAVQTLVAIWTLWMFGGLPAVRLGNATLHLGPFGYVAGAIGIVWSINLFNFMDGIDGLAGSQALLIFGTAAWLLFLAGNPSMGAISMTLAAASMGFLIWNWPPARIFMGDVGSGPLGYLAAAIALGSENAGSVPLLVFGILGGVFILDATVTLTRRVARGKKMAQAHRDHAYQRLAKAWGSHAPVSAGAAVLTAVLAVLGIVGTVYSNLLLPAAVGAYAILGVLFIAMERRYPM